MLSLFSAKTEGRSAVRTEAGDAAETGTRDGATRPRASQQVRKLAADQSSVRSGYEDRLYAMKTHKGAFGPRVDLYSLTPPIIDYL